MNLSPESNFSGLFEDMAKQCAEQVAVVDGERQWTYAQMLDDVLGTAQWLLEDEGVGLNENVCVRMDNSYELIVSCLAINYIGACWMPLNFEIPKIDSMLEDAGARLVITRLPKFRHHNEDVQKYNREHVHQDLNLFLVYSSGSTGTPKGIIQSQRAFLKAFQWRFTVSPNGPTTKMAAYIFFIWEAFRPLLCGGCVHVVPKWTLLDGEALTLYLQTHEITEIQFTPSAVHVWLTCLEQSPAQFPALKCVWLCGEVVHGTLAKRLSDALAPPTQLLNLYSISEAPDVAIGNLRENTECNIHPLTMFIDGSNVSVSETGEVVIASPTVSPVGYLGRNDLNKTKFDHQQKPALYYTGDSGSYVDGALTISGRCDFMKKIRGYSVQLDELEHEIQRLTGASNVLLRVNDESTEIHAYIQKSVIKNNEGVFKILRSELPSYAVPSRITLVQDDFSTIDPVSGKRERKRLMNHGEESLAELWRQETGMLPNPEDDFFVMGGDSLAAVSLITKINARFGLHLKIQEFYQNSTLRQLDALISGSHVSGLDDLRQDVSDVVSNHQKTRFSTGSFRSLAESEHILITGASGYLGTWLTKALTEDFKKSVSTLVRNKEQWRRQVHENYTTDLAWESIDVIQGDLELENFGLSSSDFQEHIGRFDAIVHCASLVNFSVSYARLQQTNKTGLDTLLHWSTHANFHFVSSAAIYPPSFGDCQEELLDELEDENNSPYGKSKWVLEKVLRSLEIPSVCYRAGNIGPHRSGAYNHRDMQMMLIEACQRLGVGIDSERYSIEFTPLEDIISAIIHRTKPGVVNLINPKRYPLHLLTFPKKLSIDDWRQHAASRFPLLCQMLEHPDSWLVDTNQYSGEYGVFHYEPRLESLLNFMTHQSVENKQQSS